MPSYFIVLDTAGSSSGPYAVDELKALAQAGVIGLASRISPAGDTNFQLLEWHLELGTVLQIALKRSPEGTFMAEPLRGISLPSPTPAPSATPEVEVPRISSEDLLDLQFRPKSAVPLETDFIDRFRPAALYPELVAALDLKAKPHAAGQSALAAKLEQFNRRNLLLGIAALTLVGVGVLVFWQFTKPTTAGLNDTGQAQCADEQGLQACPQADFPGQDGDFGRDAQARAGTLKKVGGGEDGFDFSKISNGDGVLPESAALGDGPDDWACTRDNVTGLLWEVKVNNSASVRHMEHSYSWYSTDSSINGGVPDSAGDANSCAGILALCNTQAYVAAVNAQGLCGFNDWRLPDQGQLFGIVSHKRINPAVDPTYFQNTQNGVYWTGRNFAGDASSAWGVYFNFGHLYNGTKTDTNHVRLVRGGQ